ncbi:hypothetical protein RchiOBHm_Chr1g0332831 [Rosa chinensis]|uniref:Transmembrane protein n=1 Tax=Rosa chinensis TaxID=74649 RepID=A0A2P6SBV8_ROSCH|nr:hypothetical protein RchiOBHm_Chr1g0332831 [Rosa chinensis]
MTYNKNEIKSLLLYTCFFVLQYNILGLGFSKRFLLLVQRPFCASDGAMPRRHEVGAAGRASGSFALCYEKLGCLGMVFFHSLVAALLVLIVGPRRSGVGWGMASSRRDLVGSVLSCHGGYVWWSVCDRHDGGGIHWRWWRWMTLGLWRLHRGEGGVRVLIDEICGNLDWVHDAWAWSLKLGRWFGFGMMYGAWSITDGWLDIRWLNRLGQWLCSGWVAVIGRVEVVVPEWLGLEVLVVLWSDLYGVSPGNNMLQFRCCLVINRKVDFLCTWSGGLWTRCGRGWSARIG